MRRTRNETQMVNRRTAVVVLLLSLVCFIILLWLVMAVVRIVAG